MDPEVDISDGHLEGDALFYSAGSILIHLLRDWELARLIKTSAGIRSRPDVTSEATAELTDAITATIGPPTTYPMASTCPNIE